MRENGSEEPSSSAAGSDRSDALRAGFRGSGEGDEDRKLTGMGGSGSVVGSRGTTCSVSREGRMICGSDRRERSAQKGEAP